MYNQDIPSNAPVIKMKYLSWNFALSFESLKLWIFFFSIPLKYWEANLSLVKMKEYNNIFVFEVSKGEQNRYACVSYFM